MPQFGLKQIEGTVAEPEPGSFPAVPWALPGARVVQVTFEVDLDGALELLPSQLSRPVPPYARIVVADYPESPLGPYREALLLLAARFAMQPKNYVVSAVVSSDTVRDAYAAIWSLPARTGSVNLEQEQTPSGESITATVEADGPLAVLRLPDAYAVEPGMIRYDPLVAVRGGSDEAEVIQVSGAPVVREARLAKGATFTCRTDAWADPWFRLRSLNMISASSTLTDMELTAPVVQSSRPGGGAMGGGLP
jgi:hypothetical protein